jgi:BirA family biotin operon repressor/biotin-[acetyl-CoA-carboxylase] ligase
LFGNIFAVKIKESLALNLQALKDAPIIQLDTIDSTNNYAMRLIDADTAQPGLTIVAREQSEGKGQRGKTWTDEPGGSLLMSIIVTPAQPLDQQFIFNAGIAVAIANALQTLYEGWDVGIKWPNDVIVNDKKAGGILIENVLRGNNWSYSIIGLGLNVLQTSFPADLPFATSLKLASGKEFNIMKLFYLIREQILNKIVSYMDPQQAIREYNDILYKKNTSQGFSNGEKEWNATVRQAGTNGLLEVELEDGSILHYVHGQTHWKWE